jgi:MFS family permease
MENPASFHSTSNLKQEHKEKILHLSEEVVSNGRCLTTPQENNVMNSLDLSLVSNYFKFEYRTSYVILLTLNISIGNFFTGWCVGVFDPIQINLVKMFDWTINEKNIYLSCISASLFLGAIIGALISSYFSLNLGRRGAYILTNIIGWIGIGMTIILNEYSIMVGRFITGISVGLYVTLTTVYASEFAPYEISGLCGTIYESTFSLGVFLCYLSGLFLPKKNEPQNEWWRIMVALPAITSLINMLCLIFVFRMDTPKYLYIFKGDVNQTKKCLRTIYKREEDVEEMCKDYSKLDNNHGSEVSFKNLFSKKYRKRLFIACVLMIAQQMNGADVFLMYSDHIYIQIVKDEKIATIFTLFTGLSIVLASITSLFIIEKFGRRNLFLIGQTFIVLDLFVISFLYYLEDISMKIIYLIILFIFMHGLSIGPIAYIYASDVVPEKGVSIAVIFNLLTSYFCTQTFLFFEKSPLKLPGTIGFYGCSSLLMLIIGILYMKETKNKSGTQIDKLFKK